MIIANSIFSKIYDLLNKYRKYAPIIIDAFNSALSFFLPFAVSGLDDTKLKMFASSVLIYVVVYIETSFVLKVYKNMWRYSGIEDIFRCMMASLAANLIFYITMKLFGSDIPFYVYLLAYTVSSLTTMSARIIYRSILIIGHKNNEDSCPIVNTMIIGAGPATVTIINEMKSSSCSHNLVKCILDDDKSKIGRDINYVPIEGDTSKIMKMVKKYDIREIIITESALSRKSRNHIYSLAASTKCKIKILPEIYSLITSDENADLLGKLRAIRPDDLLGRDPIKLDCGLSKDIIMGKVVLVTGGGGSIGSELCRQICAYAPKKLIILDEYENNAYFIQQEIISTYGPKINMEVEIATVRDENKLEKIFSTENIDIVFHAAAHKHVPLMEKNPEEAIKNNIMGTYNTAYMADKYKAEKFVLISTDKAVNPTNVMGATKRICEMIIQSLDKKSCTDFVAVRFGNVLGSNGSVIPLFIEQIKKGGPVTVTHEEITRYFMTIPEAVQLILKATAIAKGGEIFVLDMGEPVKIKDLAYHFIMLSGLTPDVDIKVEYIGLRPGEKLYEELLLSGNQTKTEVDKIFIEKPVEINDIMLFDTIKMLSDAAEKSDLEEEIKLIEKIVPTYIRTTNSHYKMTS